MTTCVAVAPVSALLPQTTDGRNSQQPHTNKMCHIALVCAHKRHYCSHNKKSQKSRDNQKESVIAAIHLLFLFDLGSFMAVALSG